MSHVKNKVTLLLKIIARQTRLGYTSARHRGTVNGGTAAISRRMSHYGQYSKNCKGLNKGLAARCGGLNVTESADCDYATVTNEADRNTGRCARVLVLHEAAEGERCAVLPCCVPSARCQAGNTWASARPAALPKCGSLAGRPGWLGVLFFRIRNRRIATLRGMPLTLGGPAVNCIHYEPASPTGWVIGHMQPARPRFCKKFSWPSYAR